MADRHVFRLGPRSAGFYDPQTRLNLSLASPQGSLPADRPVSQGVLRALRSGTIIDVNGTVSFRPGGSESADNQLPMDVQAEMVIEPVAEPTEIVEPEAPEEEPPKRTRKTKAQGGE